MKHRRIVFVGLGASVAAALGAAAGCSAASRGHASAGDGGGGGQVSAGSAGPGSTSSGDDGFGGAAVSGGGGARVDRDGDGFTAAEGDCNDDDRNVNPGAIEVVVTEPDASGHVPDPVDEDCDGAIDNVTPTCDDGIQLGDFDALHGARAVDLCTVAAPDDRKWGVLSARYIRANGNDAPPSQAVGIFDSFGPNVHTQRGVRMLAISSGHARIPGQTGACDLESCPSYGAGTAPDGFPQDNPNCPPSDNINDDVGLELIIRAPTNATGYEFRFKFYTFEYPEWVCDSYNDQFLALATPNPPGSYKGNLSFDSMGNPVSVNIGFFDVCDGPGCSLGTAELVGTGFDTWNSAGGTGWLKTQAPVTGGEEIKLQFLIFDTGDDQWDSTALIDGFTWIANGGTVPVGTEPVEEPH